MIASTLDPLFYASVVLIIFLALHHRELSNTVVAALGIPHSKLVFTLVPEIFDRKLTGSSKTLNITNTLQGALQMFVKSFPRTDVSESILHRDGIGSDHSPGIDRKDIFMIVTLDEVRSGHNFPRLMQRYLW